MQSVMIGGPCDVPDEFQYSWDGELLPYFPYFWIDNLLLNETSYSSAISTSGDFCTDDVVLTGIADSISTNYQWYQGGIAINDQTTNTLQISALDLTPGDYQFVVFVDDSTCAVSEITLTPIPEI
jgi:hypothetical protein